MVIILLAACFWHLARRCSFSLGGQLPELDTKIGMGDPGILPPDGCLLPFYPSPLTVKYCFGRSSSCHPGIDRFFFCILRFVYWILFFILLQPLVWCSLPSDYIAGGLVLLFQGAFLVTTGPAIYQAWGTRCHLCSGKTGSMLVILAIGWGLITVSSRVITDKFTWWPLIPAGILAMTGWGLYIGGNPDNALGFIGNTGSIVLIILGIYLLLLRHGISRMMNGLSNSLIRGRASIAACSPYSIICFTFGKLKNISKSTGNSG